MIAIFCHFECCCCCWIGATRDQIIALASVQACQTLSMVALRKVGDHSGGRILMISADDHVVPFFNFCVEPIHLLAKVGLIEGWACRDRQLADI
jgi:hypothetical protein